MCLITLNWQKLADSPDTNPLSETSCLGNRFAANIFLSTATVWVAVVVDIPTTSGHLEWASTYSYEEHTSLKRASKVEVNSGSGSGGP